MVPVEIDTPEKSDQRFFILIAVYAAQTSREVERRAEIVVGKLVGDEVTTLGAEALIDEILVFITADRLHIGVADGAAPAQCRPEYLAEIVVKAPPGQTVAVASHKKALLCKVTAAFEGL